MFVYDRERYFNSVRDSLFSGSMNQQQVDGQNAILAAWEAKFPEGDARHLGYCLATTKWETSSRMQPIEEYGKGAGHAYGAADPQTGQTYYGRGYVQLTWRENYARADKELGLQDGKSCEWHAANALDQTIAGDIMFVGMEQGWFRKDEQGPHNLPRYFNDSRDDPFNAREIINGDKSHSVNWDARTIGQIIASDYMKFTAALNSAKREVAPPSPQPQPEIVVTVIVPKGIKVIVKEGP